MMVVLRRQILPLLFLLLLSSCSASDNDGVWTWDYTGAETFSLVGGDDNTSALSWSQFQGSSSRTGQTPMNTTKSLQFANNRVWTVEELVFNNTNNTENVNRWFSVYSGGGFDWAEQDDDNATTKEPFITSPILSNSDTTLVVASNNSIAALRTDDGSTVWVYPVPFGPPPSEPSYGFVSSPSLAVSETSVYAGTREGKIISLDIDSGALIWEWTWMHNVSGADIGLSLYPPSFHTSRGILVFCADNGWVVSLDVSQAEPAHLWTQTGVECAAAPSVDIAANYVVMSERSGTVASLDMTTEDGDLAWRTNPIGASSPPSLVTISTAQFVYVGTTDSLVSLDLHTGTVMWTYTPTDTDPAGGGVTVGGPVFAVPAVYSPLDDSSGNDSIALACFYGSRMIYAVYAGNGSHVWEYNAGNDTRTGISNSPSVIVSDGSFYVASVSLRAYDGYKLWAMDAEDVGQDVLASSAVGLDGTVYILTESGLSSIRDCRYSWQRGPDCETCKGGIMLFNYCFGWASLAVAFGVLGIPTVGIIFIFAMVWYQKARKEMGYNIQDSDEEDRLFFEAHAGQITSPPSQYGSTSDGYYAGGGSSSIRSARSNKSGKSGRSRGTRSTKSGRSGRSANSGSGSGRGGGDVVADPDTSPIGDIRPRVRKRSGEEDDNDDDDTEVFHQRDSIDGSGGGGGGGGGSGAM